ncbi:patatin-like phospholipase family protein [Streptomyces sp. NPDC059468]|uniref:patatin-like phospholipase family protein n=1 Tax=Streptomyces sp. NPDC059468 TaxID=3346845 RepID=UPI00369F3D98
MLSGGGFRGAYQTGFLRAADEFGFQPDIVSGTSVGTLNAMLLRYLTPAQLVRYWSERVAFRNLYRIYPTGILVRLMCWFLLVPWILHYWMLRGLRFGGARGQLLTDTEVAISTKQRNPWTGNAELNIAYISLFPASIVYVECIAKPLGIPWDSRAYALSGGLFCLGICAIVSAAPRIVRRAERRGYTLFRSLLEARLREVVPPGSSPRPGAPQVFATVSVAERVFDYSKVDYYPPRARQVSGVARVLRVMLGDIAPAVRPTLRACYLPIRTLDDSLAISVASASLPLGMLPGLLHDGRLFRDGGSADNIPVFPLLDQELDEIIILDIAAEQWDRETFLSDLKDACRRQLLRAVSAEAMTIAVDRIGKVLLKDGAVTVRELTDELDARFGVRTPQVPDIHHVRLCEKRLGLTTVWASRRRIEAMQEHGYDIGRAFFRARNEAAAATA